MQYGRIIDANPDNVQAPGIGYTLFKSTLDGQWYTINSLGTIEPLIGSTDSALAVQSVAEGTADAITLNIPGVVGYQDGAYYVFVVAQDNTGNVTIDVNGLGVKSFVGEGTLSTELPAGFLETGQVVIGMYVSSSDEIQYIGKVIGDKVVSIIQYDFAEIAAEVGAVATATLDAFFIPAGADVLGLTARPTIAFTGGGATAVVLDLTEKATGLDLFGGSVDMFSAPSGTAGGIFSGFQSNTDMPSRTGKQIYSAEMAITGDTWDNLTTGEMTIQWAWGFNSFQ